MEDFAKLYNTEDMGQILVKMDENDEGIPEIRFYFTSEGLGVCNFAIAGKDDSDESWDKVEKAFAQVSEGSAKDAVSELFNRYLEAE